MRFTNILDIKYSPHSQKLSMWGDRSVISMIVLIINNGYLYENIALYNLNRCRFYLVYSMWLHW